MGVNDRNFILNWFQGPDEELTPQTSVFQTSLGQIPCLPPERFRLCRSGVESWNCKQLGAVTTEEPG